MRPLSDFYKQIKSKYGVTSACRECHNSRRRKKYADNPKKPTERSRKWVAENIERVRAIKQRWRDKNREEIKSRNRNRYAKNRTHIRNKHRMWRINNPEKIKALRDRSNYKTRSSPRGKLTSVVSCAVRHCIHASGGKRGNRTFDLLGYTPEELMLSLESKFKPGMSWENHGAWHIDHVRPVSSYDFDSVDDPAFKECWSLENLQPLWAKENLSKGARYEG